MNKHTFDTLTDAVLRDLDPASRTALTDEERERADATFARVVAAPLPDHVAQEPERRRRRRRLLVPVGVLAAAGVAAPGLLLGGGSAFATWTPTPEPLTGAAMARAVTTCRTIFSLPDQGERVMIAEGRGEWTYVLLASPQTEAGCLMPDGLLDQQDPVGHTREGFVGHHESTPVEIPDLPPDGIQGTGGAGSVPTNGLWNFGDDEEWIHSVEGYVGSDVTAVTVHTSHGVDVEASVANGRFAAWWPTAKRTSENPEIDGRWTYTLTLADGSRRKAT